MNNRRVLSVCLSFLLLLPMFLIPTARSAAIPPDTGHLQFRPDGTFKILQLADIQTKGAISDETSRFIHALIITNQPDLIVLTGDQVANSKNYETKIRSFADILGHYGVPFAAVYGNHDSDAGSKEDQLALYQSYANCLMIEKDEEYSGSLGSDRVGNYNYTITSSDGTNPYAFNLWFFDSGEGTTRILGIGGYEGVTAESIAWYQWKSDLLKERNGGEIVPSVVFQHIIVPDLGNPDNRENFSDNNVPEYNYKQEKCGSTADKKYHQQFAAHVAKGDVLAMFFGHDHKNNFRETYEGIDLICTGSVGDDAYSGVFRCGRIITLHENNPTYIKTETNVIRGSKSGFNPSTPLIPAVGSLGNLEPLVIDSGTRYTDEQINHTSMTDCIETTPATCDASNVETRYCASGICPYTETRTTIGPLGHDWGDWEVVTAATVFSEGLEIRVCRRDLGHTETRPISKTTDIIRGQQYAARLLSGNMFDDMGYTYEGIYSYTYTATNGTAGYFGTGSLIAQKDGDGDTVGTYILVIPGDLSGDSVCDAADAMLMNLALNGHKPLSGAYAEAADFNGDGKLDTSDFNAITAKSVS